MTINRREFLTFAGTSAFTFALSGCCAQNLPVKNSVFQESDYQDLPLFGLASSMNQECNHEARVEGSIPKELAGTLYRNGPGLFERNGFHKQSLLDGDGMIQAFHLSNGKVSFQNRFVRTIKYQAESKADRFLYATWTTQAPGGIFANIFGGTFENQAGVSVVARNNRLYAFDEFQPPYEMNPETLETIGVSWLGLPKESTVFSAHSKIDPANGDWIFFGLEYKSSATLHLTIISRDGTLKKHQTFELPTHLYMHDFFVTERFIILNLHPVEIGLYDFLSGQKSMASSLKWLPENGNRVLVFERESNSKPVQFSVDPSWMWHSLNAYEENNEIIADFVGYQNPDHFIGGNPSLFAIMKGRKGEFKYPGEIRRYIINLSSKKIRQEVMDTGSHEFPYVNPLLLGRKHRYGYFAMDTRNREFYSSIARVDMKTGKSERFDFGPGAFCSEPVFAPKPGVNYLPDNDREPGWLITEVLDGARHISYLAVFQAENVSAGPIANAYLRDQVPLGFHGFWRSA